MSQKIYIAEDIIIFMTAKKLNLKNTEKELFYSYMKERNAFLNTPMSLKREQEKLRKMSRLISEMRNVYKNRNPFSRN